MNTRSKEFQDKATADLQKAKAQLADFAARSKAADKQELTDTIDDLKRTHQEIEKKRLDLETTALAEMEEEKAVIEAGIAKLKAGLSQLGAKLDTAPRTKAG